MHKCNRCKEEKSKTEFPKSKRCKIGIENVCKACRNLDRRKRYAEDTTYRNKRLEHNKVSASKSLSMEDGKAALCIKQKEWRKNNIDKAKEIAKKSYENNKISYLLRAKKRKTWIKERTPDWLTEWDNFVIEELYNRCKELENITGKKFHVDHIIPLRGEKVSRLHVPNNLRIVLAEVNLSKSNKFDIGEFNG